jgi:integrase
MANRTYGTGTIEQRGDRLRLRYSIGGERFTRTLAAGTTKKAATKMLRDLLKSGDDGEHVAPDKGTLKEWAEMWLALGCPGRKGQIAGKRSLERYEQILNCHIIPGLGHLQLQAIGKPEIEGFYRAMKLADKISPSTQAYVHVVLSALLAAAVRNDKLAKSPMVKVENKPRAKRDIRIDEGLTDTELREFVERFRASSIYEIVALLAATGCRRNEALALTWRDLNVARRTLTICKALEESRDGIAVKEPKNRKGTRTIGIDQGTLDMLLALKERHVRLLNNVVDSQANVVPFAPLPSDALIFPKHDGAMGFSVPRVPSDLTNQFARRAKKRIRLHDLRGIRATLMIDAGLSVTRVAEYIGDDPKTLLASYLKKRGSADEKLASVIDELGAGLHRR